MSFWKIAWRSIQQRSLASTLTAVSMALGVMLVVAVMVVGHVVDNYFMTGAGLGYNLVIGKKGGEYQLVLNTVYYLGRPIENIPWSYYKEFLPAARRSDGKEGKFAPWVDKAVPCNLGDYFGPFRVVGTTAAMFGTLHDIGFAAGENFHDDDFFSGVIGATVAKEMGLGVGDKFKPTHAAEDGHVHDEQFAITGILEQTGTPIDRALFINIEGFFLLRGHALEGDPTKPGAGSHKHDHKTSAENEKHSESEHEIAGEKHSKADHDHDHAHHNHEHDHDHDHSHHEPLPEEKREVTAVLVLTKSVAGLPPEATVGSIYKAINKDVVAQAVQPIRVITEFLSTFLRPLQLVLLVLTVLIVVVSAVSILVSIYNSMAERRHEIAVMRALGAGRGAVMRIMLLESILLALGGGFLGWLVGHAILSGLTPWLTEWTGVTFPPLHFTGAELLLIPGIIALASLVGFLPAWSAYRTDVAKALTANP
jgi:putative ABC transport system permease protein